MTVATREALRKVAGILRDAGWDQAARPSEPTAEARRVGQRLEELCAELGLDPGRFRDAVLEAVAAGR
jgi:hypothetical protein